MNNTLSKKPVSQLPMPVMPARQGPVPIAGIRSLSAGREVIYHGNISGGPRYGAKGIVRQAFGHRVLVDMGAAGVWYIPYYFLSVPNAKAA